MNQSNALKKKPRGKAFEAGRDARRNANGQRNAAAVATAAAMREMYLQVLAEPIGSEPVEAQSKIEEIVRQHVSAATAGDAHARETLLDRIWGKSLQPLDVTSSDGTMTPTSYQFIPYDGND
jgi:hypothetical protein